MNEQFHDLPRGDQSQIFEHLRATLGRAVISIEQSLQLADKWGIDLTTNPDGDISNALLILETSQRFAATQAEDCRNGAYSHPEAVNNVQYVAIGVEDREDMDLMAGLEPENLLAGHYSVWANDCDNLDFQGDVLPHDLLPVW